eukprot:86167-Prorocentrum_minimum.AAC.1
MPGARADRARRERIYPGCEPMARVEREYMLRRRPLPLHQPGAAPTAFAQSSTVVYAHQVAAQGGVRRTGPDWTGLTGLYLCWPQGVVYAHQVAAQGGVRRVLAEWALRLERQLADNEYSPVRPKRSPVPPPARAGSPGAEGDDGAAAKSGDGELACQLDEALADAVRVTLTRRAGPPSVAIALRLCRARRADTSRRPPGVTMSRYMLSLILTRS